MTSRPTIDRKERDRLLRELRRRQVQESARELTPAQRIEQTDALLTFCRQVNPDAATSDEPPALWLRLLARLRRGGCTRGAA